MATVSVKYLPAPPAPALLSLLPPPPPPPPPQCLLSSPWRFVRLASLGHGVTDLSLALIDDALSRHLGTRRYLGASTAAVAVVGCVQVLCSAIFTPAARHRICRWSCRSAVAALRLVPEGSRTKAALQRNGHWPPFGRLTSATQVAAAASSST